MDGGSSFHTGEIRGRADVDQVHAIGLDDLKLVSLMIVYPSERPYPLAQGVEVVPLAELAHAK